MTYQVTHQKDQGKVRGRQEDNCYSFADDEKAILILSDGMGGHAGGDLASIASVDAAQSKLHQWPNHSLLSSPTDSDDSLIHSAQVGITEDESPDSELTEEVEATLEPSLTTPDYRVTLTEWIRAPNTEDSLGGTPTREQTSSGDTKAEIPQRDLVAATIENVFNKAQRAVCDVAATSTSGLGNAGCTLTVALMTNGWLHVGHIGDSRAYIYRQNKLEQLTLDHSGAMLLVAAGLLTPEAARHHPESHSLYRFLGLSAIDLTVDVHHEQLHKGDIVMLCSDGLWGMIEDDILTEIMNDFQATLPIASSANISIVGGDLNKLASALIHKANELGGEDNISVSLAMV